MNMKRMIAGAFGLLVAVGAANVEAQDGTASAPEAAPASTAASPKAMRAAERKANRLLAKAVRRALVKIKGLDSSQIVVVAKSGAILLGGSVPVASQIDLAVPAATGVTGVSSVNNSLTVKAVGQ
ncbi:BON domain-containing protein [Paraburkholderia sp. J63]|uniref:BON domain-containing protein n=1 Tax=Paraburkholderia sp. J63 TaxID=2805434 RepID=UPI002ABD2256|nr:BON domain-containing protein [Paraburkholderia sp. J63]